jgi:hypothetical protein
MLRAPLAPASEVRLPAAVLDSLLGENRRHVRGTGRSAADRQIRLKESQFPDKLPHVTAGYFTLVWNVRECFCDGTFTV